MNTILLEKVHDDWYSMGMCHWPSRAIKHYFEETFGNRKLSLEELDYMIFLNERYLDLIDVNRKYYDVMIKSEISSKMKELFEEVPEELKKEARIEFLEEQSLILANKLKAIYERDEELSKRGVDSFTRSVIKHLRGEEEIRAKLKKYVSEKKYRVLGSSEKTISEETISLARNYPMEKLLEFDSNGLTRCIFHEEKTPSLSFWRKKNLVRCFGCGKVADSIDVFMKKSGRNFVETVKILSNI